LKRIDASCDLQFFVCVNERAAHEPLPSCGTERGNEFFKFMQKAVFRWGAERGLRVWVNRSLCQGFCSKDGITLSVYPLQLRFQAVSIENIPEILSAIEASMQRTH